MSDWNPDSYLKFRNERTQPSIDLVSRIHLENPNRIIDLGCGPGNSTEVLKNRWPNAEVIGLDSSSAMIKTAKETNENISWHVADASGDLSFLGSFDLIFSNAVLQWMPDHHLLLPKLYSMLNRDGVLAVQVPYIEKMPIHIGLHELEISEKWHRHFINMAARYTMHSPSYFYDILSRLTSRHYLWQTDYIHIMDSPADIVNWFSATGLRPYLDCLMSPALKSSFLQEFENIVIKSYPPQLNGKLLFPFTRLFFVAQHE